jgi:hypothetical protein
MKNSPLPVASLNLPIGFYENLSSFAKNHAKKKANS